MGAREKLMQILDKPVFPDGKPALEAVTDYLLENDVVAVVRCKDCEYSRELDKENPIESRYPDGVLWCAYNAKGVFPSEYCSDGGRRD